MPKGKRKVHTGFLIFTSPVNSKYKVYVTAKAVRDFGKPICPQSKRPMIQKRAG